MNEEVNEERFRDLKQKLDRDGHLSEVEWAEHRGYERQERASEFAARGFHPDGKTPLDERDLEDPLLRSPHHTEQALVMPEIAPLPRLSLIQKACGALLRFVVRNAPPDLTSELVSQVWDAASIPVKDEIIGVVARQALIERLEKSVIPQAEKILEARTEHHIADLSAALEGTRMFMKPNVVFRFHGIETGMKVLAAEFDQRRRLDGLPTYAELVAATMDVGPKQIGGTAGLKLVGPAAENDDEGPVS